MKYAITLEKKMSKDQILEGYLNIAYYGDGAYGVETAARHFFSTTAAKLTLPQSAMLAGLVQQPGRFDPRKNPKAALARRNIVLDRMLATKVITQKQHDAATKTKLGLKISKTGNGCDASRYPFFCDYVYRLIKTNKAFGATVDARRALLFRGGLTVKTTLDPSIQRKAQKAIADKVKPVNKSKVAAAMSVVEPGTGKVLAMVQSQAYGRNTKKGQTTINYNVDNSYGGGSGFQPGSTFKAFTLAAALAEGKSLSDQINAPQGGTNFPASDFPSSGCWPKSLASNYPPYNAENRSEVGNFSLRQITEDSINTGFVRLESEVGVCKVKDMAEALGMHGAVSSFDGGLSKKEGDKETDEIRPRPSMTLGSQEVAPLTVAAAYATFAADGTFCEPISIVSATTLAGKKINVPKQDCNQVIDENIARGVTVALEDVIRSGTAAAVPKIGRPAVGKTGTANDSWATWFTGYVPQLSASVWFGHPKGLKPMKNIDTGKRFYGGQLYGATVSAPIWSAIMSSALEGVPVEDFGKASDKIVNGERVTVPGVVGQPVDQAKRNLEGAGFSVRVGSPKASGVPAGSVAEMSPGAGSRVSRGTTITLYPSTGVPPKDPNQPGPGTPTPWRMPRWSSKPMLARSADSS